LPMRGASWFETPGFSRAPQHERLSLHLEEPGEALAKTGVSKDEAR
jgi:hypothetical protein